MRLIKAFLQLIRWQNLVFIILTQALFYYCIFLSLYKGESNLHQLIWLIVASVSIAAAGYIINDYFDLNIDKINKPEKNVINSVINRRWAIIWHFMLSLFGFFATIIAVGFSKWYLILANAACISLLWFYSTSFKRQLLIGNVVISLLTVWTILIMFFVHVPLNAAFANNDPVSIKFFRISFLYASFAFIISIIREAIKDIEDMIGDEKYGCRTLPIVAGIRATKIYIAVWLIVIIAALIVLVLYILQFGWQWATIYIAALLIAPLLYLLFRLSKTKTIKEFSNLSLLTKLIMLVGILSMLFFRLYF